MASGHTHFPFCGTRRIAHPWGLECGSVAVGPRSLEDLGRSSEISLRLADFRFGSKLGSPDAHPGGPLCPLRTDIVSRTCHVRKVPLATSQSKRPFRNRCQAYSSSSSASASFKSSVSKPSVNQL